MKSLRSASLYGVAALAVALSGARDADACGGFFTVPSQTESTVVAAHRMAFAISPAHTVLWDQIQYTGDPGSFAWVLPIKAGATIEVASDAFFEVLEAATSARVVSPEAYCSTGEATAGCGLGCGAGAGDGGDLRGGTTPPVTVVHAGTVGPYDTVTLHANVPNALPDWLSANGYAVDPSVSPVINDYVAEGFDFIALRLQPDKGVRDMQPVRITTQGMSPVLPLRMVAAGTGPNVDIALFVISEGLYVPENFPVEVMSPSNIGWSFTTNESNYAEERADLLATNGGRTWNLAYSKRGPFLSSTTTPRGQAVTYTVGSQEKATIAQAYVAQGQANGDVVDTSCLGKMSSVAGSSDVVVNLCSSSGGGGGGGGGAGGSGGGGNGGGGSSNCTPPAANQIDMRDFVCGELTDLAIAFEGLHPADVWLTRLESNLPHASLANDLVLHAASNQVEVSNWFYADKYAGDPCTAAGGVAVSPRKEDRNMAALFGVTLLSLGAAAVRRIRRRK